MSIDYVVLVESSFSWRSVVEETKSIPITIKHADPTRLAAMKMTSSEYKLNAIKEEVDKTGEWIIKQITLI